MSISETAPISSGALWTGRALSGLIILFMIFDGAIKLPPLDVVTQTMVPLGWPADANVARMLGVIGLIATALYALPRTSVLGAILLTAYMGGAIATNARIGNPLFSHTLFGVYLGIILWGGLYLRNPRIRALLPFTLWARKERKMFSTILIILLVIIAAILVYAATRPNDFVTTRTATIKAPPEAIFPLINDFSRWPTWSPYEKLDPNMKRTLSGAQSGKGAAYAWEGNGKAGKGRMEIVSSVPSSLVALKLDFEKPFRASNSVDFTLTPSGDTTAVSWAMRGSRPFIAKLMGLFMNFDTLIGRDFEIGLANLKRNTEA